MEMRVKGTHHTTLRPACNMEVKQNYNSETFWIESECNFKPKPYKSNVLKLNKEPEQVGELKYENSTTGTLRTWSRGDITDSVDATSDVTSLLLYPDKNTIPSFESMYLRLVILYNTRDRMNRRISLPPQLIMDLQNLATFKR